MRDLRGYAAFYLDRDFMKRFLSLVLPMAAQSAMGASLTVLDGMMVGRLGPEAMAAVQLSAQLWFIFNLFCFGVASGGAMFVSQYYGARDVDGIHRVIGLMTLAALAVALPCTVVAVFAPQAFLRLYTPDAAVVELGAGFLRFFGPAYLVMAVSVCYSSAIKATRRVKLPLFAGVASLIANTVLNYCLIFGNFGFPAMGVNGAALATLCATLLELALLIIFSALWRYPTAAKLYSYLPKSLAFAKRYFKIVWPIIAHDGTWGIGATIIAASYGAISTATIAALSICNVMERLGYIMIHSMASGCNTLVGISIGAEEEDEAQRTVHRSMVLIFVVGVISGLIIILARPLLLMLYPDVGDEVRGIAGGAMLVVGITMLVRPILMGYFMGAFRPGGDARFAALLDVIPIFALGIPLVYLAVYYFKWPLIYVLPFAYIEDIPKIIIGGLRIKSRKWIHNVVRQEG